MAQQGTVLMFMTPPMEDLLLESTQREPEALRGALSAAQVAVVMSERGTWPEGTEAPQPTLLQYSGVPQAALELSTGGPSPSRPQLPGCPPMDPRE